MSGISPRNAGAVTAAAALDAIQSRVSAELGRERAQGQPLKAAYQTVARRLGITARRVRAFHHHEVPPSAVTAEELLAVDAAYRADFAAVIGRIEALRGLIGADAMGDPLRGLALPTVAGSGRPGDAEGDALGRAAGAASAAVKGEE